MDESYNLIVKLAATSIENGEVIAYPTSSIWGLGCSPFDESALQKLCQIKQRPTHKGLILIAGGWQEFASYFPNLTNEQVNRIITPSSHPCTWLVDDQSNKISHLVKGNNEKVAIRIDSHPFVKQLCSVLQHPITSTSANPSGKDPATSATEVVEYFGKDIGYVGSYIAENKCFNDAKYIKSIRSQKPSDIRDLASGEYIRRLELPAKH